MALYRASIYVFDGRAISLDIREDMMRRRKACPMISTNNTGAWGEYARCVSRHQNRIGRRLFAGNVMMAILWRVSKPFAHWRRGKSPIYAPPQSVAARRRAELMPDEPPSLRKAQGSVLKKLAHAAARQRAANITTSKAMGDPILPRATDSGNAVDNWRRACLKR